MIILDQFRSCDVLGLVSTPDHSSYSSTPEDWRQLSNAVSPPSFLPTDPSALSYCTDVSSLQSCIDSSTLLISTVNLPFCLFSNHRCFNTLLYTSLHVKSANLHPNTPCPLWRHKPTLQPSCQATRLHLPPSLRGDAAERRGGVCLQAPLRQEDDQKTW